MTETNFEQAVHHAVAFLRAAASRNDLVPKAANEAGASKAGILAGHGFRRIQQEHEALLKEARRDADAFDSLRFGAAQAIAVQAQMPQEVWRWIVRYLQGQVERPIGRDGAGSKISWHVQLVVAVDMLALNFGLSPTRNDASPAVSACDAVAEALTSLDLTPSTFGGVRDIYRRLKRATGPDGGIRLNARGKP